MYSIIAVILLIIILIEFYYIIKNYKTSFSEYIKIKKLEEKILLPKKYHEYSIKGDKIIDHLPGYILIKDSYNIFIKEDNKTFLAKKDVVYNLKSGFSIEVLDVNGKNTIYYYVTKVERNKSL
jgi:hypothetical protein